MVERSHSTHLDTVLFWRDTTTTLWKKKKAHYVAIVRDLSGTTFSCVADGESTVRYVDRLGTHVSYEFMVLVLRYDPCDLLHPPFPCAPDSDESVDPTGYLHWTWRKEIGRGGGHGGQFLYHGGECE